MKTQVIKCHEYFQFGLVVKLLPSPYLVSVPISGSYSLMAGRKILTFAIISLIVFF
jgi:hypothetical protein